MFGGGGEEGAKTLQVADPRVVERIEAMSREEQDRLILALVDYADGLIRAKTRWIDREILPKGFDAQGLALEAIKRVLDGAEGTRQWNPEKDPDLLAYLKSVVKSILWHLQKAAEKERLRRLSEASSVRDKSPTPYEEVEAKDGEERIDDLKERMLAALNEDEDKLVLMCLFDGKEKPAEIACELGMDVKEVNNRKRKVRRRLSGFEEELRHAKG